jgi:hypothetical protein
MGKGIGGTMKEFLQNARFFDSRPNYEPALEKCPNFGAYH